MADENQTHQALQRWDLFFVPHLATRQRSAETTEKNPIRCKDVTFERIWNNVWPIFLCVCLVTQHSSVVIQLNVEENSCYVCQQQPHYCGSCRFVARGGAVTVGLLRLFVHISMAVASVAKHSITCQTIQQSWGNCESKNNILMSRLFGQTRNTRGWKRGWSPCWLQMRKRSEHLVWSTLLQCLKHMEEKKHVLLSTGQAYRRADRSAGPVQEDQGGHDSHTGWVPLLSQWNI